MATRQVAPEEWNAFFDGFSRRHDGWLVTVEALSPDMGDQIAVSNLPLRGISVEQPSDGGETQIELLFVARDGTHLSHTIDAPQRIWIKQNEHGSDEALELEAPAGTTLLHLRSPLPAEMVDGIESA